MSRDPRPDEERREPPEQEQDPGRLRPTGPGPLIGLLSTGLVLGWLLHPASIRLDRVPPRVGWLPVLALVLAAVIVAAVARSTHRTVHRRHQPVPAYQAVNRLVLAKACALAGALVGGGYLGYALSWVGARAELAGERLLHSGLAGAAGLLLMGAGLLLERACKVRSR